MDKTGSPFKGNFGIGPLIASLSPGRNPWMYLEARPFSYLLMRNVNSPGVSDREIGVYALITGFPFASVSPSGLEDFTTTQEATGSRDASSSFSLKTNLGARTRQPWKPLGRTMLTLQYCGYRARPS